MLYYARTIVKPKNRILEPDRQGGRSCSGTTGGVWCANCGPPAPAPGPSYGWRSASRESPLARICWGSPASCAPWAWSRPATTGSWTSSTARPWIRTNSPAPGALWSSDSTPASFASTSNPSSSATASRSPRPDAKCPGSKSSIKNPTQTPSRSTSSATPARPSPCSPKPCPALDKMILLLDSLDLNESFYFVADAYYASGKNQAEYLLAAWRHQHGFNFHDVELASALKTALDATTLVRKKYRLERK